MQTVIDSMDVRSVLQRAGAVGAGISEVVAAEKEVVKSKAVRLAALRREAQRHADDEAEAVDARLHRLAAELNEAQSRLEDAVHQRAEWIKRAWHASRATVARRNLESKDRRIGRVQGEIMRRRQDRQRELEEGSARHHQLINHLLDDRQVRQGLRKSLLGALRSYRFWIVQRFNGRPGDAGDAVFSQSPEAVRAELLRQLDELRVITERAGKLPLAKLFRVFPLWVFIGLAVVVHGWRAWSAGGAGAGAVTPSFLLTIGAGVGIWLCGWFTALPLMRRASEVHAKARALETLASQQSARQIERLEAEIREQQDEEGRNLGETFRESEGEWRLRTAEGQRRLDERLERVEARLQRIHQNKLNRLRFLHDQEVRQANEESSMRRQQFELEQQAGRKVVEEETQAAMVELAKQWKQNVRPALEELASIDGVARGLFPEWTPPACAGWEPPAEAPGSVRIGALRLDLARLGSGLPQGDCFDFGGAIHELPFALGFPDQASLMLETDGAGSAVASSALQGIALRLLASLPPGRISFVFIDPVGLGKDFSGLMHLADYEETLIHHRIWTQQVHIEERLAEVNDHIEKVIQMYLRDEYANITDYNRHAGVVAEKYRFVVIAGFPAGFSDTAAKRLRSIASSGSRCGVYFLIQRDLRQASLDPALDEELRRHSLRIMFRDGRFMLDGAPAGADEVVFDAPPSPQDSIALVHRIGRASVDSNRVEVPFVQVAPAEERMWMLDTSDELQVPIGRTGARKLQMLSIGKGTRQHVLVAGKTGSGKSTLFHVIITNLALWCAPEQVEFYLVDFKKGVEFKCYAAKRLPHARVVAIESDREFALSVLQRVDAELKRRGELFRRAGTQDLPGYRRVQPDQAMPRTLLLIDEFQEFFTEDDAVAQEASLLLDRIVRQGRAFGIHVILGSQTLGGAYTLARATLGQMVIRIALQCNETDAHLIMDDDNPAPRLLTRPGEGIYNDQAGALAANSPFQIVWLSEGERDQVLDRVAARAACGDRRPMLPVVFEGNAPADVRDNPLLKAALGSFPESRPRMGRGWLGAPNSIKGPTEAVFQRQSGSHLLVVGQSRERTAALLCVLMISLAAQYPEGQVEFLVLDPYAGDPESDDVFRKLAGTLPVRIAGPGEVAEVMSGLAADLAERASDAGREACERFVFIQELQRFKALRPDDDFRFSMDDDASAASPAKVFADLLGEGAPSGIHVIASTDTWNNVSRWIPRKLMAEFEMRVLFQMSANDSANLIDSQAATTLGLHRALYFNEQLGALETFRPYSMPEADWLEEVAADFTRRRADRT